MTLNSQMLPPLSLISSAVVINNISRDISNAENNYQAYFDVHVNALTNTAHDTRRSDVTTTTSHQT
jgi:hypothetical protein